MPAIYHYEVEVTSRTTVPATNAAEAIDRAVNAPPDQMVIVGINVHQKGT